MRFPRIKAQGQGFYHVISRIVAGVFVFGTAGLRRVASEKFRSMMGRQAAFSGVQILDYSLMSNHFHLICFVPEARPLSVDEVLERIGAKIKISDPSLIEGRRLSRRQPTVSYR
jgi:putative transposase